MRNNKQHPRRERSQAYPKLNVGESGERTDGTKVIRVLPFGRRANNFIRGKYNVKEANKE